MHWKSLTIKKETGNYEPIVTRFTHTPTSRSFHSLISSLVILIVILYPLVSSVFAFGTMYACANSSISIDADESVDHHAICKSAEDGLAFFNRLDIKLTGHLVIEIAQNLPDWMSETAVGCYDKEKHKVFVLTFPAFEKRQVWCPSQPVYIPQFSDTRSRACCGKL